MTLENAYAEALIRAIEKGVSPADAVKRLLDVLKERGMEGLVPRIGYALRDTSQRRGKKEQVTLTVARKADTEKALSAAAEHLVAFNVETSAVEIAVDDSLVGGHILAGKGMRIDNSYKRDLLDMYKNVVEAVRR